jgi:hypothetical protein
MTLDYGLGGLMTLGPNRAARCGPDTGDPPDRVGIREGTGRPAIKAA